MKGSIQWLFSLLDRDLDGRINAIDLIDACALYYPEVPLEYIRDTLAAVEVEDHLTEDQLYNWLVFMFGECSENEFVIGVNDFGIAAKCIDQTWCVIKLE